MGIDHDVALSVLCSYPNKWVRPGTNARLLSYLLLALKGEAIAVRDEDGYLFRLAGGRRPAVQPSIRFDDPCELTCVPCAGT